MLRPRTIALSTLLLLASAVACDRSPAPLSLRMQMYKVDASEKLIARSLGSPELLPAVAENAKKIADIAADVSFDRYEKKPSYRLPADELDKFRAFRQALGERAKALEAAARGGDVGGVSRGYAQMKMLCETCHASFRPGL